MAFGDQNPSKDRDKKPPPASTLKTIRQAQMLSSGGAIIAWQDTRDTDEDIYAQRVTASGVPGSDIVPVSLSAVLITAATMGLLGIGRLSDLKLNRMPY